MELRTLGIFVEVAREENISRASSKLYLSQPSISRQLRDLEKEIGKKLFDRTTYGVMAEIFILVVPSPIR